MPVKIIKAQNPTIIPAAAETVKLRVCAYCRVSSDSEEQETSYEAQVTHYTNLINDNPLWSMAGIFADQGLSGTQAKTRPEFNKMIAACESGLIDMVITKSISRFARNTLDCLNYIRKLKALSIPILFEKESINTMDSSGEVLVTILASIAQQESASISANVRMGIEFGFQEGHGRLNYSTFLGYKQGGKPGTYAIIPEEAEIVRRIYREYLEGYSPYMICERLMADKICTPAGGEKWYASTIYSILENEKYCGDLLMQKYFTKDFLTHKVLKNTGQKPQYFVEDDHDPIVPRAVYYQVQGEKKRRAGLKQDPSKLRFGNRLALNGRLICGKCGRTLKRYVKPDENQTDWRCRQRAMVKKSNTKEQPGSRCDCRIVRELEAQRAVVMAFNELPNMRDDLLVMQERLLTGEIGRIDSLIQSLTRQQEQLEERLEQITDTKMNVVDEKGHEITVDGSSSESDFLRSQIISIRHQKDALYAERAEHANREVQIRILLELVEQLYHKHSAEYSGSDDGSCREYEDFFRRTAYHAPAAILSNGKITDFDNGMVIRYLESIVVNDDGYTVRFKAGIEVKV